MNTKISQFSLITLLVIGALYLIKKGFENQVDPLWIEVTKIASSNNEKMIFSKKDDLQLKFNETHQVENKNVIDLIGEGFTKTLRFSKFDTLVNRVLDEKKLVILYSAGNGGTFIIPKVALFVAGSEERFLKINCDVNFESKIYDKFIGKRDLNNNFYPGKLLKFLEKCKQSPNEKFVLLLNDIGYIHRSSVFGEELWKNLRTLYKTKAEKIEGYDKDISIPENLYIISSSLQGRHSKYPLSLFDYWKLSNKTPYNLGVDPIELKALLVSNSKDTLNDEEKNILTKQLYFFAKISDVVSKKVGKGATIGQYTRIRSYIKKNDYEGAKNLLISNILNYSGVLKVTEKDFSKIDYTLSHNGKLKNSHRVGYFFSEMIDLGVFSELTVAGLFAVFSFLGVKRMAYVKKKKLTKMVAEAEYTQQQYLTNRVSYDVAYGNLLSIEDLVQVLAQKGSLNFSQVTYLMQNIQTIQKNIDFIYSLEGNEDLANFVKTIIGDDDITEEEYLSHTNYLSEIKFSMDKPTYKLVKQQLVRLYNKSNLKYGRVKI